MMLRELSAGTRRTLAWIMLLTSCVSFSALAIAEQHGFERGLAAAPPGPLPFDRSRVFGIDLRGMSSLDALEWLQSAGNTQAALVAVPIDGDVVSALGQEGLRNTAHAALDQLVQAAGGAPIAACLERPAGTVGDLGVAQAAVDALTQRYTASIAYLSACEDDDAWQGAIAQATLKEARPPTNVDGALIPFSTGTTIEVLHVDEDDLDAAGMQRIGGSRYVLLQLDLNEPVDAELTERAIETLVETPQAALVLLRPDPELDATTVAGSIGGLSLPAGVLPKGFSRLDAPALQRSGDWAGSTVGTTTYQRGLPGALLTIEFTGTDLSLVGLLGPDGGTIAVWVDPAGPNVPASATYSLAIDQAQDGVIPIAESLPARRHRVVVLAQEGEVVLSGIFVTGALDPGWSSTLPSLCFIVIAVLALTTIMVDTVQELRGRTRSIRRGTRDDRGHPRVFASRR